MSNRCTSYRGLIVWQKSVRLAIRVHDATRSFPGFERFGLATQVRRAAVSVASNVAEGAARRTTRDFLVFLHVARGSLAELNTQLLIAAEVGYLPEDRYSELQTALDEVGRLLGGMIRILRLRREAAPLTDR
jgi:four helix bundle protein